MCASCGCPCQAIIVAERHHVIRCAQASSHPAHRRRVVRDRNATILQHSAAPSIPHYAAVYAARQCVRRSIAAGQTSSQTIAPHHVAYYREDCRAESSPVQTIVSAVGKGVATNAGSQPMIRNLGIVRDMRTVGSKCKQLATWNSDPRHRVVVAVCQCFRACRACASSDPAPRRAAIVLRAAGWIAERPFTAPSPVRSAVVTRRDKVEIAPPSSHPAAFRGDAGGGRE
jgi:hypothetical protein